MNLDRERELFEKWYDDAYMGTDGVTILMPNNQYSSRRKQHSWDAWLASASRDGYKLVAVEPTYDHLDSLKNSCALFQNIGVSDIEAYGAYKAMLGAVE